MTADVTKRKVLHSIADAKESNDLVDLISGVLSGTSKAAVASIRAVSAVFDDVLQSSTTLTDDSDEGTSDAMKKYKAWLRERYSDAQKAMLKVLTSASGTQRELSLQTLMKWIELETNRKKPGEHRVPCEKLKNVVLSLLSREVDMKKIISKFSEYLELADVRMYTIKIIAKLPKDWQQNTPNEQHLKNVYYLLLSINMTPDSPSEREPVPVLGGEKVFVVNREQESKRLSSLWISFLQQKLPAKLYRELLILLPDKVIPHLHNPLLVADFFIESYNRGGALSVMALNGLFILIHKYHLDYPNFYEKLYALLVPDVFYQKYRARFFFLMDLFLSSTHIPAYLVAAFAKKLARLCLTAPPYALPYVIPFINNLLIRHKGLGFLINSEDETSLPTDPYDVSEPDPAKSRATESSLWELKTLQSHWHPTAAKKARFIEHPLQKIEQDFSEVLEDGYRELMEKAKKAKHKETPVNFHPPAGLLKQEEECLSEVWDLD